MVMERKQMGKISKAALYAGVSLLFVAQGRAEAADAEDQNAAASAPSRDRGSIEEIVVTARRRSEGLLETPVAVTAFNAADLERRSIQTLNEIQANTPSLIYESTGGNGSEARIFIRGVGNATANITAEQGVGIYIDGMYYARAQGALLENLDIASLEVLRGPQGTLFGKNTIGGAINITTIKPSFDAFSGQLEMGYGRFDRVHARASLNIPLGDRAAVRISGMRDRDHGYTVNDFNGTGLDNVDVWSLSGALRFEPTDNLTLDAHALYTSDNNNNRAEQCVQVGANAVLGAAFNTACAVTNANGINHTNLDAPLTGATRLFAASTTLAWNVGQIGLLDDLTFKMIGGYQWSKSNRVGDFDATYLDGISSFDNKESRQISGELQILGKALNNHLNFVIGTYADKERTPGPGVRTTRIYPFLEPAGRLFSTRQNIYLHNNSKAVYSQATYDFNPIVSVTGGVRYTDDTKGFFTFKCTTRAADFNTCIGAPLANGNFSVNSKSWTPMANLQLNAPKAWTQSGFLDQAMLYFTYSKGFKSGGFNGNGQTNTGNLTGYRPERVQNYEVGTKFSLLDRHLTGSIAAYDMKYKDIQLSVQGLGPLLQPISSVFNAGAAKIRGLEIELQAVVLGSLRISGNADFTHARYTEFVDLSVPGGSRANEPLAYIPPYRLSGSIENRFALKGEMALTPRIQVTRTGDRYLLIDKSTVIREIAHAPAFTTVDASLRYDYNDQLSLQLFGKNIFNKRVINDAISFGYAVNTFYNARATYGATLRAKF
jgi:iron complex outermembrane receptor protein